PAVETDFNVVTVQTDGSAPPPTPRLGVTSTSCGWCGSDQLDDLAARLTPLPPSDLPDLDIVATVPQRVRDKQSLFAKTGAVHAAAVFDEGGGVVAVREDVGRHNAVDKILGERVLAGAPLARRLGLFVS